MPLGNLRSTASGKWGKSPRHGTQDLPEWTKDFQQSGWAATPNPEAGASKQEFRARLMLWLILASLPISLLSCVIALPRQESSAPGQSQISATASTEWSLARSEAQVEAYRWLRSGGLDPTALAWRESRASLLPCSDGVSCEVHFFTTLLGDGERALLAVTVDPVTGIIAGVNITEEPEPEGEPDQQSDEDEPVGPPLWSDSMEDASDGKPLEDIEARISEWASAWARRDLRDLAELAGGNTVSGQGPEDAGTDANSADSDPSDPDAPQLDAFVLGDSWWVLNPAENVEVSSLVEGPSPSMLLATATFSLVRECTVDSVADDSGGPRAPRCSECSTRVSASQKRFCDGSLDITADLWIEASRPPVLVQGSAYVGGLDPQTGPASYADADT